MSKYTTKTIILLAIIVISYSNIAYSVTPTVLGKVIEGGYIVVYDNYTISINGIQYNINNIPIFDLKTVFTVTYSEKSGDIVFIGFYNESSDTGIAYITIYNIKQNNVVYNEIYKYSLVDNKIKGRLLSEVAYIPDKRMIVSMYINSTSAYIQLSNITGKINTYEAPVSFNFYVDNNGVYAALIKEGTFNNRIVKLVTAVNLITGEELATYPALIPVVDLVVPLVQLFNENGTWIGYVTVFNPSRGELEYYRVVPGSLELLEEDPVVVSPDLKYVVKLSKNGTIILLPDGSFSYVEYNVRPAPIDIYLGIEPTSGIIDVDRDGMLLRVVESGYTKIIYKTWNGSEVILYTLQGEHSRLTGLYSLMDGKKVVILDPNDGKIIQKIIQDIYKINRNNNLVNNTLVVDGSSMSMKNVIALMALVSGVVIIIVFWRRERK